MRVLDRFYWVGAGGIQLTTQTMALDFAWGSQETDSPHRGWKFAVQLAAFVVVLNLLDAVLTLLWIHLGIAEEANTLWGTLVETRPMAFVLIKLAVVFAGVFVLVKRRDRPLARMGLGATSAVYAVLLGWHITIATIVF